MVRSRALLLASLMLAAAPTAFAQGAAGNKEMSPEMQGPPNANGRAEDKAMTAPVPRDETTSASHLSGPPNANGYSKP